MVKIWFDKSGIEAIIKDNPSLQTMEQDIMMKRLDAVKAAFMQEFGFEGQFTIKSRVTQPSRRWGGRRTAFMITPADAKTGATLNKHPGWLGKFT